MTDLIWIGNTLYPRWFVFAVLVLVILAGVALVRAVSKISEK